MSPSLLNITPELSASIATKTQAVTALLADIAANWSPATFAKKFIRLVWKFPCEKTPKSLYTY